MTFFLRLRNDGLVINQVFWGLWLFPIGVLRASNQPRYAISRRDSTGAGTSSTVIGLELR